MQSLKDNRGVTLVEVVAVLGIFVLITTVAIAFVTSAFRLNGSLWGSLSEQQTASRAVRQMTDELRLAQTSSVDGAYIEIATSTEIAFFTLSEGDSYTRRIRYFASSTDVYRGVMTASGDPLVYGAESLKKIASNVVNSEVGEPLFVYYDDTFTGSESPLTYPVATSSVSFVDVRLFVQSTDQYANEPLAVTQFVHLRNAD